MANELINVPILKNLIKNEIDRKVNSSNIITKLKQLEEDTLNNCVEIYGIHDSRLHSKKIRNNYLKKICSLLLLNYKLIVNSDFEKNYIKVKLNDAATAKEWQNRSREVRLKNYDLDIEFDGPVKIFVAASAEQKYLLKKTRDALLPRYKYVSLCKKGVMVRQNERSKIFIVKNESDIYSLLAQNSSPPSNQFLHILNIASYEENNKQVDAHCQKTHKVIGDHEVGANSIPECRININDQDNDASTLV
ncbi:FP25K [Chrysodeixis includens nucleopolyhedrovirus]|uniref:FP25K n=1 Tax=Chrysodeixis includens nucleopolyhedrovirus TaxID=1207438 RepID=A0A5B8YR57_9ABAC|nr:FP25K [Chrysodeixis includens nucleopolyhedrovirus]QED40575.1 FP25K [Chrysodeixis includens nucleopolyhedrovirus]